MHCAGSSSVPPSQSGVPSHTPWSGIQVGEMVVFVSLGHRKLFSSHPQAWLVSSLISGQSGTESHTELGETRASLDTHLSQSGTSSDPSPQSSTPLHHLSWSRHKLLLHFPCPAMQLHCVPDP